MVFEILGRIKKLINSNNGNYHDPMEVYRDAHKFLDKEDLVYFPKIGGYGIFKYTIVKDVMLSGNAAIGVSSVALGLNSIYFSKDELIHRRNKKVATTHLSFLSPKLQFSDNEFTHQLFERFFKNLPKNSPVDLTDNLINPIVFIHVLEEYGLLDEVFRNLDPKNEAFTCSEAIRMVWSFLDDADILESIIAEHIANGGKISSKMEAFANDLRPGNPLQPEEFPRFLRSIIFVSIETTTSFVSTLIYTLFTKYAHVLEKEDNRQEVYGIANELLRLYPPVPFVYRTVWEDTNYHGVKLTKGTLIMLFLGAANRDANYFENPLEIVPGRKENHLTFGAGSYACIGRFAGFRMAMNMLQYLKPYGNEIEFLDKDARHIFHNAIQKLPLNVTLR